MPQEIGLTAYLRAQENKDLLRFITCGSVDDGKSTLIGRLLYEGRMLFEDQLATLKSESAAYQDDDPYDNPNVADAQGTSRMRWYCVPSPPRMLGRSCPGMGFHVAR